MSLVLRRVRPWGCALADVRIGTGRIVEIAPRLDRATDEEFDGRGALLLPGLHDHHLHVMATAARRASVDLAGITEAGAVGAALRAASSALPRGAWLRAVGFDERAGGLPDAGKLDTWVSERPVKLLDRTGALWVLNHAALSILGETHSSRTWLPAGAERDADGRLTGRFWREDRWLGKHLPRIPLDLARLGSDLAGWGLIGLTDAGAGNGPDEAAALAGAGLPQRLLVMGSEALGTGPLKLLIDERDPPDCDALASRIATARAQGRAVAAHCVTATELALFLAALDAAGGARSGDRIEHGGEIDEAAIAAIAVTPLTVVTNPGFIAARGDRYRATIAPERWPDLYRAGRLVTAGIPLAAGSDAPYGPLDPWEGMRSARDRLTASGHALGPGERLSARRALELYLGSPDNPGGAVRPIAHGAPADVVLCEGSLDDVLADLAAERVVATFVGGKPVFVR